VFCNILEKHTKCFKVINKEFSMTLKNKDFPKISFVLCTFNGDRTLEACLSSFFEMDYPKNKLELIIADGGSKDKSLDIIEKYRKKYPKIVRFYHNKKQFADGKGMGIDIFSRKAKYDFIGFIDQDNIFVQKDWLKKMIFPMIIDKELATIQSRLIAPKNGPIVDKYFGAIGVEDPFAIPYSLTAQIVFNPKKFKYLKVGDYYRYKLTKDKFLYGGNNGCIVRKDKFLEAGGYSQDNDEFYRFALRKYIVGVPRNARLHHATATDFKHFLIKRGKYVRYYLGENYEGRDVYWFDLKKNSFSQNMKFIKTVLFNLLIIPGLFQGIYMALKERRAFWLIHPLMLFSITLIYGLFGIYTKIKGGKVDLSQQSKGSKKS
jgi:glycosyltransferase involved in cell wall biosynthesis